MSFPVNPSNRTSSTCTALVVYDPKQNERRTQCLSPLATNVYLDNRFRVHNCVMKMIMELISRQIENKIFKKPDPKFLIWHTNMDLKYLAHGMLNEILQPFDLDLMTPCLKRDQKKQLVKTTLRFTSQVFWSVIHGPLPRIVFQRTEEHLHEALRHFYTKNYCNHHIAADHLAIMRLHEFDLLEKEMVTEGKKMVHDYWNIVCSSPSGYLLHYQFLKRFSAIFSDSLNLITDSRCMFDLFQRNCSRSPSRILLNLKIDFNNRINQHIQTILKEQEVLIDESKNLVKATADPKRVEKLEENRQKQILLMYLFIQLTLFSPLISAQSHNKTIDAMKSYKIQVNDPQIDYEDICHPHVILWEWKINTDQVGKRMQDVFINPKLQSHVFLTQLICQLNGRIEAMQRSN